MCMSNHRLHSIGCACASNNHSPVLHPSKCCLPAALSEPRGQGDIARGQETSEEIESQDLESGGLATERVSLLTAQQQWRQADGVHGQLRHAVIHRLLC